MAKRKKNPYCIHYVMDRDGCSEKEAQTKVDELKSRTSGSLSNFIRKYGKEEGTRKYNEKADRAKVTLDNLIKKYGKEEGTRKWDAYREKKSYNNSIQYYIDKYGEEEGKLEWEKKKRNADSSSLNYFINKYGEEEGKQLYKQECDEKGYRNTLPFYIERYGDEEGNRRYKHYNEGRKQTLPNFIKKYGKEEGKRRYDSWIKKFSYSNTKQGNIDRYGEEEGLKRYNERINKMLSKLRLKNIILPEDLKEDYKVYKSVCARYMGKKSDSKWVKLFNDNPNYIDPNYERDHKFSIFNGFLNNIPMYIINHPFNIDIITGSENRSKRNNNSITLEELYEGVINERN